MFTYLHMSYLHILDWQAGYLVLRRCGWLSQSGSKLVPRWLPRWLQDENHKKHRKHTKKQTNKTTLQTKTTKTQQQKNKN